MNPKITQLHSYPFEKLAKLKAGIEQTADKPAIVLSIGEPKHDSPAFVLEILKNSLNLVAKYPLTRGSETLRETICQWLIRRFKLKNTEINAADHVLPVNGTREALFSFAQAVIDNSQNPLIIAPNPFYQIYEGAAILAGSEIQYLNTTLENNYEADLTQINENNWKRCQLVYLCTPGNPTGKVLSRQWLAQLIELADRYNFIIASDECYSEIYFDENDAPAGLLEVAASIGHEDFKNCIVFHSLSKRSNLPGLRSGFVAGDKAIIKQYLRYRTYHGCAMPGYAQEASIAAWNDETHVIQNRNMYREKFDTVFKILQPVLDVQMPDAGFYLWPRTPIDEEIFARNLFAQENITVLPGSYLSRTSNGINPGSQHIRLALVANHDECTDAANRIRQYINRLK